MSARSTRRRGRALGLLAVAVLVVHALLLFTVAPAWIDPDDDALPSPPLLSVRSVVAAPPAPEPAREAPRSPVVEAPARAARPRAAAASRPAAPPAVAAVVEPNAELAASPASAAETPLALAALSAEAAAAVVAPELPTYATRPPAAGQWRYELQRGLATGEALLRWAPEADGRYALQLEGRIAGVTVLDWASRGEIDSAGLAPETIRDPAPRPRQPGGEFSA
jgi:hypothetical protein